jgi:hypothetical protein
MLAAQYSETGRRYAFVLVISRHLKLTRIRIHNISPVHKYGTDTLILVCGYWLDLDKEYH